MKKTFLVFVMISLMLTSCETIVTPSATATPLPTPTAIVPTWKNSQLIDSSSQVVIPNETQEYQFEEIFGSGIALDSDTRWTIDVQVDNMVQDVGEAATAIFLQGFTKSGILQNFIIAFQKGNWKILYQPDYAYPNYSYQYTFENLTTPIQHFELSISADGKSISLINDAGFEFHHTMQEKLFDGAEVIMVTTQIGPQTQITFSKLIVSQLQKDEIVNSPSLPDSFLTPTATVPENGKPQYVFHVAVNGNDTNPGTSDKPFATIEHTRDVIRTISPNMQSSILVNIHGGTYSINQPIIFTTNDSGQNGYDIIYRAVEGETPIFSGGINVANWEKVPDSQLWKSTLQDVKTFRQLYINGIRAQRAASQKTVTGIRWTAGDFSDRDGISISSAKIPEFLRPQDLELHWIYDWKDMRLLVNDITVRGDGTKIIWMKQPYYLYALWMEGEDKSHEWIPKFDVPFYLENAFELLDKAGEWYYNPDTHELFYMPRDGENMNNANVIIPQTQSLLEISGGLVGHEVHNLAFEELSFEYAGWTRASEQGVYGWQAQNLIADTGWEQEMTSAHVLVNSARDIRFEHCRFEHLGAVGLHLNNNVFDVTVQGNLFHDISDGAIVIGKWDHAYITAPLVQAAPRNNLIANNLITDIGVEYWSAPAITAYYVNNLRIIHNEISNIPYTGISVGWGWIWTLDSVTSHDNLISDNLITDIAQRARDAGGIYTLGQQPGSVVDSNVVRRVKNDNACLYPDEGSSFITFQNNVCDTAPRWLEVWTDSIHDIQVLNSYTNVHELRNEGVNILIENTVHINGQSWTQEAQTIIDDAGLELAYSYLHDWLSE